MNNPQWLKQPISQTNFLDPKDVRARVDCTMFWVKHKIDSNIFWSKKKILSEPMKVKSNPSGASDPGLHRLLGLVCLNIKAVPSKSYF